MHRREWLCSQCNSSFPKSDSFRKHLEKEHHKRMATDQIDVMVERGSRATEHMQKYPLCQTKLNPCQLRSHLGRHMEQIALFILPGASEEDEEIEQDPDSDDEIAFEEIRNAGYEGETIGVIDLVKFMAKTYINTGPGVGAYDSAGYAPIHRVVQAGDCKTIKLLLDSGADPNALLRSRDEHHGKGPLHMAVEKSDYSVIKLLSSQSGVNVEAKPQYWRQTALMEAYRNGDERSAEILSRIRDDIRLVKLTLFDLACIKDDWRSESQARVQEDIAKFLLAHETFNVNESDLEGKTLLLMACFWDYFAVAKQLLACEDTDDNAKDKDGKTGLTYACMGGHRKVIAELLERDDIDVNTKDNTGITALMYLC
ncbi:ankyrin repeat-containing domain protein [Pyronema domesticum]|nr:ankyrin repeat-containing domain protein [Pyronema domesticum]